MIFFTICTIGCRNCRVMAVALVRLACGAMLFVCALRARACILPSSHSRLERKSAYAEAQRRSPAFWRAMKRASLGGFATSASRPSNVGGDAPRSLMMTLRSYRRLQTLRFSWGGGDALSWMVDCGEKMPWSNGSPAASRVYAMEEASSIGSAATVAGTRWVMRSGWRIGWRTAMRRQSGDAAFIVRRGGRR